MSKGNVSNPFAPHTKLRRSFVLSNEPWRFILFWSAFLIALAVCALGWLVVYSYYRPQRSWAKVMFLQASVILSTGGDLVQGGVSNFSGGLQFFGGSPIFGVGPPIFRGGSPIFRGVLQFFGGGGSPIWLMSGRYASYWNAFLLTSPSPDLPEFRFWTSIPTKNYIVYQHGNRRGKKAISSHLKIFKSKCVSGDYKQVAFCQKCSSHRVLNISKPIFSAFLYIS